MPCACSRLRELPIITPVIPRRIAEYFVQKKSTLESLLSPRSIAIVGASANPDVASGQTLRLLLSHGYTGPIYPVNPKYESMEGLRCYPDIEALPQAADLAVIAIGARHVPEILEACGRRGVANALVLSSGFAESGPEGIRLQSQISEITRRWNIGLIGPNCQGLLNTWEQVYAGFGPVLNIRFAKGPVSMVSQSGGFGFAVVNLADAQGVGFRHVVTTGNEAGISSLDIIRAFVEDPETRVIAAYVEGFKDAHRMREVGRFALANRKPVLVWKVGNSVAGRRAAASHTANLGGEFSYYRAAFRQYGFVVMRDVVDLVDASRAFLSNKVPLGRRVAIVTVSGGAGILAADECAAAGLEVPDLSAHTLDALRKITPDFGSLRNPVDLTGGAPMARPGLLQEALQLIASDPQVDSIAVMAASWTGVLAGVLVDALIAVNSSTTKPLFVYWSARPELVKQEYSLLESNRIPRFETPVRCAWALGALVNHAAACRRALQPHPEETVAASRSAPVLPPESASVAGYLPEHSAAALFSSTGIAVARASVARSAQEAVAAARKLGFPVALKVHSADIPHKTEAGGIKLNLLDDAAVVAAYLEVLQNARNLAPDAKLDGVLVQEMVADGLEVIVGASVDPAFGPVVMVGLGGVHTEILKDVSFRLAPIERFDAVEMIEELRGYQLLLGARGAPRRDIEALVDAVVAVSRVSVDLAGQVAELEINPLLVLPEGRGVKAADALVRLAGPVPPGPD